MQERIESCSYLMGQLQNQILISVAMGPHAGGCLLSRQAFLHEFAHTWEELLLAGAAHAIRHDGRAHAAQEAVRELKIYAMAQQTPLMPQLAALPHLPRRLRPKPLPAA